VATVIVHDYQLSLAIGREGQNARLAARLTGWRIDIKSETQLAEEEAQAAEGYAEGEWLENATGELVWQPADGGEAVLASDYYAEESGADAAMARPLRPRKGRPPRKPPRGSRHRGSRHRRRRHRRRGARRGPGRSGCRRGSAGLGGTSGRPRRQRSGSRGDARSRGEP